MGIISKILRSTPLYKYYTAYNKRKNELAQIKIDQQYLPLRVKFYKQFLNDNDLVFDVGANIGNRVEAFLLCNSKVVAVEPQPSCVKILQEKFGDRIIIENIGLSDEVGELEMQISSDPTVSTFSKEYVKTTKDRFKYSTWESTIKVPISTLDNLLEKYGKPKFCKIDVEGFELHVLKGLNQPIQYISLEYCVPELKIDLTKCIDRINQLSTSATYNYSIGESMVLALDTWMNFSDFKKHIDSSTFISSDFGDVYIKSF